MAILKASELRIGNFVKEGHEEIVQIDRNYFEFLLNNPSHFNNQVSGIKLTEEWLLKFGFSYDDLDGNSGKWKLGTFSIIKGSDGFCYDYEVELISVHQLQNLYFALPGKELELKK